MEDLDLESLHNPLACVTVDMLAILSIFGRILATGRPLGLKSTNCLCSLSTNGAIDQSIVLHIP